MTAHMALSVRQPWAWLILHGGKDIENRTWRTRFRGRVLIHASKGMTNGEYLSAGLFVAAYVPYEGIGMPRSDRLPRGGIVGSVEIVDCVTESDSPWFVGPQGFVLRAPEPLEFQPCKGALGFFEPKYEKVPEPAQRSLL